MKISEIFGLLFFALPIGALAQSGSLSGRLNNADYNVPEGAVVVTLQPSGKSALSDTSGQYRITGIEPGRYTVRFSRVGLLTAERTVNIGADEKVLNLSLRDDVINLSEVTVTTKGDINRNPVGKLDVALRPVNSSQDLLRLVPGLFIAQHAGGGKAEQIFLRGFDVDHGTDFAIFVDGVPVNMVSHAHGQGYADLHFVIPETVRELQVFKGPYNAAYGDLATSGAGEFVTQNFLPQSQVKLEYGMFNTYRALAMIDLLKGKHLFTQGHEGLHVAGEYKYTDAYFQSSQNFNRYNLFAKYTGVMKNGDLFNFTASNFGSTWDASGQVPQRKISDGTISRFGAIDNTEGGSTGRTNANAVYTKVLSPSARWKNQVYYSKYDFNLYSNFTFFLEDSVNGDQIRQNDNRNLGGVLSQIEAKGSLFGLPLSSKVAIGGRYDHSIISLGHSVLRVPTDTMVAGTLNQLNAYAYADETLTLTDKLRVNLGARLDQYFFDFQSFMQDSTSGSTTKARVSPKVNLIYTLNPSVELYARTGLGFHSNDARAVVVGKLENTLPKAFGYEAGSTFKLGKRSVFNTALWALDLESELIYVGDAGVVENSGRTRRYGIDFGMRYQLSNHLFADLDVNYNKGILRDEPEGANRIPLAPSLTSIGGLTYKADKGFSGSLRYRFIDDRPANELNTVTAEGYFLLDASVVYTRPRYQLGLTAENLTNTEWNEAQFDTESRLRGEPEPVSELHFTPGTPFFLKGHVAVFF